MTPVTCEGPYVYGLTPTATPRNGYYYRWRDWKAEYRRDCPRAGTELELRPFWFPKSPMHSCFFSFISLWIYIFFSSAEPWALSVNETAPRMYLRKWSHCRWLSSESRWKMTSGVRATSDWAHSQGQARCLGTGSTGRQASWPPVYWQGKRGSEREAWAELGRQELGFEPRFSKLPASTQGSTGTRLQADAKGSWTQSSRVSWEVWSISNYFWWRVTLFCFCFSISNLMGTNTSIK